MRHTRISAAQSIDCREAGSYGGQTEGATFQGISPVGPKQIQAVAGSKRFRFLTQRFSISTASEKSIAK
jgi:hypothetical protein